MKRTLISLLVLCTLPLMSNAARADRVDKLTKELRSNPSYKVRLTAVLSLAKYADPRAVRALIGALGKKGEDPRVRGFAAMALGRLRVQAAIPALKRACRSKNGFLKSKAKSALESICPSSLKGKRFYVNMDRVRSSGPLKNVAKSITLLHLSRILAGRRDVVTGWPRCKKPSSRDLRRHRMKGFYLDTKVTVKNAGGKVASRVSVLFTTYPDKSIKGNAGAGAAVPGKVSSDVLSTLLEALVGSLKSDIARFLDSQ